MAAGNGRRSAAAAQPGGGGGGGARGGCETTRGASITPSAAGCRLSHGVPGIPIIAPGERLTPTIVDYLEAVVAAGGMVEGAADESLAQLRVAVR
jgi:hypothetical protein